VSEDLKLKVAKYALNFISNNTILGLGTGSTIAKFIELLAEELKKGNLRNLKLVPTSTEVEYLVSTLGIDSYLVQPWQVDDIDIAIDGADEVDHRKNLIKGGGAALTREKIIDYRAKKLIIIIDESKLSEKIGTKVPIPIEVLPISWRWIASEIKSRFGGDVNLRVGVKGKRGPIITDNGNYILDWKYRGLDNPEEMEYNLKAIPGVIESGIFNSSKVYKVVIAKSDSTITEL